MDFVRLGAPYSTSYLPDKLIDSYSSLIWTERYDVPGEFELKTFDIENMQTLLPLDTLVSHLETEEVMIVETHAIEEEGEGADARPVLTIKGRSAESFLENRWIEGAYQKKRPLRRAYTAALAAGVLISNAIDNASGKDITRGYLDPPEASWQKFSWDEDPNTEVNTNDFPWTTLDTIPNVAITETVAVEGDARKWFVTEGPLYPQVMKIIQDFDLGLRVLRPKPGTSGNVVTYYSTLARRGEPIRTPTNNITALRFDIYKGLDKSATVQFAHRQGHLEKPQYLDSVKDYKTVVEIMASVAQPDVSIPGGANYSGWRRRIASMDGGSPEIPEAPTPPPPLRKNASKQEKEARANEMDRYLTAAGRWRNKRNAILADFKEANIAEANRVLKAARRVKMFAADISALAPYKYKTHYNLGDLVMLYGDYKYSAKMRVVEYVRTEDSNGDRGYPGLVTP